MNLKEVFLAIPSLPLRRKVNEGAVKLTRLRSTGVRIENVQKNSQIKDDFEDKFRPKHHLQDIMVGRELTTANVDVAKVGPGFERGVVK